MAINLSCPNGVRLIAHSFLQALPVCCILAASILPSGAHVKAHARKQGHSVFVEALPDRLLKAIKGCVRGGAVLARQPPRKPQPSPKVESDDTISTSAHGSVRSDPGLSEAAWHTPSFRRPLRAGVLCDVMWCAQL